MPLHMEYGDSHYSVLPYLLANFRMELSAVAGRRQPIHRTLPFALQEAKMRLNANHGINRKAAVTLKQTAQNTPVMVKDGEEVVVDYPTMHKLTRKAWAKFFDVDPGAPSLDWTQRHLPSLPQEPLHLEPLRDEDLMATLKDSNRQTTAGPDGWRTDELCRLPPEAIAHAPQPPLDYATTRQRSMVAWFKQTAPSCIYSYLPAHDAGLAIAAEVEAAKINQHHRMHHGIYIASLDASKAFPSASRPQLWAILMRMGMPAWVAQLFESGYAQGQTTHRLDGRFVSDAPHRLRRGIYQGCPVSTMAFVSLQIPLVHLLREKHPTIKPIIYADDLTVIAMNHQDLQAALRTICLLLCGCAHTAECHKNPILVAGHCSFTSPVGDDWVKAAPSITVLGCSWTNLPFNEQGGQTNDHSEAESTTCCTSATSTHAALPAIQGGSLCSCNLREMELLTMMSYAPTETQDAAVRTRIISTLFSHLKVGPRSPHMPCYYSQRSTELTPTLAGSGVYWPLCRVEGVRLPLWSRMPTTTASVHLPRSLHWHIIYVSLEASWQEASM